jgi:hypothetical protein
MAWGRHEDFQSCYRSETMCHYRSLCVSVQAFNGGRSRSLYRFEHIVPYSSGKVVICWGIVDVQGRKTEINKS